MRKEILVCDECGTEGAVPVTVTIGAGEPSVKDLCVACVTPITTVMGDKRKATRRTRVRSKVYELPDLTR